MTNIRKMCWKSERQMPGDAELVSHQLMLRAGLICKLASGIYTWLPMGLRVLRKVESVLRDCLAEHGAEEVLMPMVQPANLWQETKRWDKYGAELLRLQDRHDRGFCLGPTHEEVITDWGRNYFSSHKQLPACVYQIQTKFRDEIRPRFGVMRSREFIMKDAYSFHLNQECLDAEYVSMLGTYKSIFNKLGLVYKVVEADSGSIGGNKSHEFQVLSASGEDEIAYCNNSDYAANVEEAVAQVPSLNSSNKDALVKVLVVSDHHACDLKVYLMDGASGSKVAVVLCREDQLNLVKLKKHILIADECIAVEESFVDLFAGGLTVLVDSFAASLVEFSVAKSQNEAWHHVVWQRDVDKFIVADLRKVKQGDLSPCGKGELMLARGIEVGHIFQLEDCYSKPMQANVLGENGVAVDMLMGCYGIGVSRIVAAAIEQSHDKRGIIWPKSMAPFDVHIIVFNGKKSAEVNKVANDFYCVIQDIGYEVLFDDRDNSPGSLMADADLLGVPWRLIISEKSLEKGGAELKARDSDVVKVISLDNVIYALSQVEI